jgi:hypothetical protein
MPIATNTLIASLAKAMVSSVPAAIGLDGVKVRWGPSSAEKALAARTEQLNLLRELSEAGIDVRLFDLMLSNELDRSLKRQFGVAFFLATLAFTAASYAVIVLNGIFKWGISEIAITSLIVETPIQFIGLLYIIARNLFPSSGTLHAPHVATGTTAATRKARKSTGAAVPEES